VVAVVWQFDIRPGMTDEFERLYGADGDWTKLSRRSRSFLGSSFLRDIGSESRYLLVEYWGEMVVYEKHVADFSDELSALERERERLVDRMETVGVFTALDVLQRAGPTWSRRTGK
jgi:quinol monooxygenase YgiN